MGRGLVETLEIDRDEFIAMSPQLSLDFNQPLLPSTAYYALRVPTWLETVLKTSVAYNFPLIARGLLVGAMIVGLQRERLCLLYTSDAADERSSVDLGGRRIIKKKKDTSHAKNEVAEKAE